MRAVQLVVIGASLGGMRALQVVLGGLNAELDVPIAVVLHRHRASAGGLAEYLLKTSPLPVIDVDDKQPIRAGTVYLAPANYHLLVERDTFSLSVDEPVAYSRPSIDVLFESAADAFGKTLAGVLLTGSNSDGAMGVKRIKQRGGFVIVQDPATAEAREMPEAAIAAARVDRILPLERIGPFLVELCRRPDRGR